MTRPKLSAEELETIAAFIDGRLDGGERTRFLERLDRDPALYEVFMESVRSHHESPGDGAAARGGRETSQE